MSAASDGLTESIKRAGAWATGQMTRLDRYEDFRDGGAEDDAVFRILVRRWTSVPNGELDGLCGWLAAVSGQTAEDVTVDGQVYAGAWTFGQWWVERSQLKPGDMETFNVVQVLWNGEGSVGSLVTDGATETVTTWRYEWASYAALRAVAAWWVATFNAAVTTAGFESSGSIKGIVGGGTAGAVSYQIGGMEKDRETRKWKMTLITKKPKASYNNWKISSRRGFLWVYSFKNQTKEWLDGKIAEINSGTKSGNENILHTWGMNEYGMWDGWIHSAEDNVFSCVPDNYWTGSANEMHKTEVIDHTGAHWVYLDLIEFTEAHWQNNSNGLTLFSGGGPGSKYVPNLRNDTYYYKKVTGISRMIYPLGSVDNDGNWTPGGLGTGRGPYTIA